MNDRELLELAAKAAGIVGVWHGRGECIHVTNCSGMSDIYWRPLEDDGDALRLAVKLELLVDCMKAVAIRSERKSQGHNDWAYGDEDWQFDENEAVRRAIVNAAAQIGQSM